MSAIWIAAALAAMAPAMALDCIGYELQGSLPADGAVAQPLNALVLVQAASDRPDALSVLVRDGKTGTPIPAEIRAEHVGTIAQWVLRPDGLLEPVHLYQIEVHDEDDTILSALSFSTGTTTDEEPPSEPAVLSASSSHDTDTWGEWYAWTVEVSPAIDASGVRYQLELADSADFTDPLVRTGLQERVRLYDSPCNTDPAAQLDAATTWLRVSAVDVAGNISGSAVFEPPGPDTSGDTGTPDDEDSGTAKESEGGCSATGRAGSPLAAWSALVGLLGVLRRRRSATARG